MNSEIEMGDVVKIDFLKCAPDSFECVEPAERLKARKGDLVIGIVVEIRGTTPFKSYDVSLLDNGKTYRVEDELIAETYRGCETCRSELMYSDYREKWLCPRCELR